MLSNEVESHAKVVGDRKEVHRRKSQGGSCITSFYVSNIQHDTTSYMLSEAFQKYGRIVNIYTGKSFVDVVIGRVEKPRSHR